MVLEKLKLIERKNNPMSAIQQDKYDDEEILPFLRNILFANKQRGQIITQQPAMPGVYFDAQNIDLNYDVAILAHSTGKDSWAALKVLLDMGYPKEKIEIWHHLVDGNESGASFMDWAFVDDYAIKIGQALGIPVYFSWLKHGFKGEMLKANSISHPLIAQTPYGLVESTRKTHKLDNNPESETFGDKVIIQNTRQKFPQQAASLASRWCSSALKIDVARFSVTSQDRFIGKRVLFITGERREESSNRARYNQLEPHATDTMRKSSNPTKPRHVDAWRPILNHSEGQVWELLEDWRINPPVPYKLGWGRSSCQTCVFNDDAIWATIGQHWPERLAEFAHYEKEFKTSIARNGKTVDVRAANAKAFEITDFDALEQSMQKEYTLPIFLPDGVKWSRPAGAFNALAAGAN